MDEKKKQGQYGTASQGTREREESITGSTGVQNKKGEIIDQGSTTGVKGGQVPGRPDQLRQGQQGFGQRGGLQEQGQPLKGKSSGVGGVEESEEE